MVAVPARQAEGGRECRRVSGMEQTQHLEMSAGVDGRVAVRNRAEARYIVQKAEENRLPPYRFLPPQPSFFIDRRGAILPDQLPCKIMSAQRVDGSRGRSQMIGAVQP